MRTNPIGALYSGKLGTMEASEGLRVRVGVMDAKKAFGHLRFLVTPINGSGEKWVAAERVTLDTERTVQP